MSYITVNSTGLPSQLQAILDAENVQPGSSISYQLCKLLWEYHPLAGKIIEKPVRLALGKSRKIDIPCGVEDQLREAFEREWDRLGATNHIRDVMHLSRVYGAAAIVYGSPDIPTDKPIDPWKLAEVPELYFNQLDPLNLAGSLVTNQNPNAPDFQKPWQYITAAGQPYHPSRSCVIFCGTPIYLSYQGSSYSFSGRSLFLRALYPLKSFIQTMTVDDLVSLKSGLLIAKITQPGSIVNKLMSQAAGAKRQLLQEAQTGNVLSIQPDESIESINLQNTDKAMTTARDNIIANIAAASDVPALLLKDEAFTQGFGEGKEDSKAVAQYIEGIRNDMHSLFMYFDNIVQHRAWNSDLYQGLANAYPDEIGNMSYKEFFYWAKNLFKAEWPSLLEEPQSETVRRDADKLKAMVDVVKTLETMLDPVNKAKAVEWFMDNVNSMTNMFPAPMTLDIEALAEYQPPQPGAGENPFGGPGGDGAPEPEGKPEPKPEPKPEKSKSPEAKQDAATIAGRLDAEWDESKHPRAKDGKFGKGGGGGSAPSETKSAAPEPKTEPKSEPKAPEKPAKESPQEAVAHEKWTEADRKQAYSEIEKDLDQRLTGKKAEIQERFARQLSNDFPGAVADYAKLPDSEGGKVLNVDTARELSPDYNEDRTQAEPVHEPGSWFIKKLYADMLAQPPGPERKTPFSSPVAVQAPANRQPSRTCRKSASKKTMRSWSMTPIWPARRARSARSTKRSPPARTWRSHLFTATRLTP
jgi:hypothetical protein